MKKICEWCGKRYNPDTVDGLAPMKYCSEKCYKTYHTDEHWIEKYDVFLDDSTRRDMQKNPDRYYDLEGDDFNEM